MAGLGGARFLAHLGREGSAVKTEIGANVIVDPVLPDVDPYIFQFQNSGKIVSYARGGGCMIRLHSAVGEWGPVPPERLQPDRSHWRTGDWH